MKKTVFLLIFLLGLYQSSFSEEIPDIDGMFKNPPPDLVVVEASPKPVEPSSNGGKTTHYFGYLNTDVALISGFKKDNPDLYSSFYYLGHLQGGVDARPIPQVRVYGILSTLLPQGLSSKTATSLAQGGAYSKVYPAPSETLETSNILSVDELYLDYTVLDTVFFKAGKFSQTWGQGHIFNPGNLTDGMGDGVSIKTFVPAFGNGITGIVIGRPSYFPNLSSPNFWEFGFAGAFETTIGPLSLGVSGFHQLKVGNIGDLYLKTAFWGFDVFAEGLVTRSAAPDDLVYKPQVLTGFFWEGGPQKIKITAEYWLNGNGVDYNDQKIGVGITCNPFDWIGLKPSARWLHSLRDNSGQIVLALESSPFPSMDLSFGVPITYGNDGSEFVTNNSDPLGRWISPAIRASINIGF